MQEAESSFVETGLLCCPTSIIYLTKVYLTKWQNNMCKEYSIILWGFEKNLTQIPWIHTASFRRQSLLMLIHTLSVVQCCSLSETGRIFFPINAGQIFFAPVYYWLRLNPNTRKNNENSLEYIGTKKCEIFIMWGKLWACFRAEGYFSDCKTQVHSFVIMHHWIKIEQHSMCRSTCINL